MLVGQRVNSSREGGVGFEEFRNGIDGRGRGAGLREEPGDDRRQGRERPKAADYLFDLACGDGVCGPRPVLLHLQDRGNLSEKLVYLERLAYELACPGP
jgi:hypothetical protein